MATAQQLRHASRSELRDIIRSGYPVDPGALEGWAYRGTSLGLPSAIERFSWKTFQKTFWREPATGRLVGWNVRLRQDGLDAPSRPFLAGGVPVTTWHYEVVGPAEVPTPPGFDRGLIIDYELGAGPSLDPVRLGKDPLVALSPGSADELIGVTYLVLGGRCVETPTYFTLERDHRIDHVPALYSPPAPPPRRSATSLLPFERRWAEAIFAAVLPGGAGLPAFAAIDRDTFWRCLEQAPAPSFGVGLRAMVHALTFLPVADARLRRPFFQLSEDERRAFVLDLEQRDSYPARQLLTTMKTLACFAYFDDPIVRERFDLDGPVPGVSS